jgi:ubiquinone/menaquinone biosynthesis C-methylase UbiE
VLSTTTEIRPLSESDVFIPGHTVAYWWDYDTHMAKYVFAAQFVQGKDVLDIGCGVGYGSSYLLMKGAKTVTGVEISLDAVELAKQHYARTGLEFMAQDASALPFRDDSFDVVACIGMIDHVDDPDEVLIEIRRVLRPGGWFLCSLVNREFITLPFLEKRLDPFHKTEFNPAELSQLCAKYFSDIQLHGEKISKLWYITCSISSALSRTFPWVQTTKQKLGRLVFRQELRPLVYDESLVDTHFPNGSQYMPFVLKEQSHFSSFTVVGVKTPLQSSWTIPAASSSTSRLQSPA